MIIKDKKGDEYVNLEDIDYIRESDSEDYCLDICYIVKKFIYFKLNSGIKKKLNLLFIQETVN
jgi:hypothetical protein